MLPATNLEGAKCAVEKPTDTYNKAFRIFMDIAGLRYSVKGKLHGIVPGNDGNCHLFAIVADSKLKLKLEPCDVSERSEVGVMARVSKSIRKRKDVIVFGWGPFMIYRVQDIMVPTSGDDPFGSDYGGATIWADVGKEYVEACPSIGRAWSL